MAITLPVLDECDFSTDVTDDGRFIGRVRQFPDLRTRPQKSSLDATDQIITLTRNKLARLAAAVDQRRS